MTIEAIRNKIHQSRWLLFAVVLTIGLQAGCGQKGPLYFPDEPEQTPKNE